MSRKVILIFCLFFGCRHTTIFNPYNAKIEEKKECDKTHSFNNQYLVLIIS